MLPCALLQLLPPLSCPSTGSWFPPGCKDSSASLCSKFIHTCSSSWMGHIHSAYVNPEAQLCQAGRAWPPEKAEKATVSGWFMSFQLQGGCCRCGVSCGMLCGTQVGNWGLRM